MVATRRRCGSGAVVILLPQILVMVIITIRNEINDESHLYRYIDDINRMQPQRIRVSLSNLSQRSERGKCSALTHREQYSVQCTVE